MKTSTSGLVLLLSLAGCAAIRDVGYGYSEHPKPLPPGPPVTFVWPTPEHWQRESRPFPLENAPNLPYRGLEERRLAPDSSFVFVWWIESGPRLERATIEESLKEYFGGDVELAANIEPGLVGSVRTEKLLLYLRTKSGACGDHHFLLVKASPKPTNDATWASLNEVAASFQCR